jgi:hypothetical protein
MGLNRERGRMEERLALVLGEAVRLRETAQDLFDSSGGTSWLGRNDQVELARATDYVATTVDQISIRLTRLQTTLARINDYRAGDRLAVAARGD